MVVQRKLLFSYMSARAQAILGGKYFKGKGVSQDYVQARSTLLLRASRRGRTAMPR